MEDNMTAVDWLFQKLWDQPKDKLIWRSIFSNAKTFEEEELKKFYQQGYKRCSYIKSLMDDNFSPDDQPTPEDFETFYKKTYGK
jgi:hypothetical protein